MSPAIPSRRDFLKTGATFALGAPFIGRQKAMKPNLLFIWTDEQRADTLAVYGNQKIHAPNLNRLAGECVVFENAYVSQPVCTPSRATVMTGLWPHQTGCIANNVPLPKNAKCFPEILNDPDYRTGYFGKWHLGDEVFAQHGFQEWQSMEDGYRKYFGTDRDKDARSTYSQWLKELGYKPDGKDEFSRGFCSRLPIEHCKPKFLELKACEFLQRYRREPFVLYVNFLEPHMPFSGPLNNEHDPSEVTLPANFNDPLEENEPLRYRKTRERYAKKGYDGLDLKTEADWRRLIARYWGLVTQVDRSVGAILKTLDGLGLAENTIVVYTSDHGDMMGSHRLLAKTVMYEEAVRVPWLMRIPKLGRRQQVVKGRFSQIDLVPTLLDLMGRRADGALPGQSLVPLIRGGKVAEDHAFIEWNRHRAGSETEDSDDSVRTVIAPDGWKLCLSDKDKSQLFNLNKDPGETTNLFYSGEHRGVIKKLADRIFAWQKKVGDQDLAFAL